MPNSTNNLLNKNLLRRFRFFKKIIYIVSTCLLCNLHSFSQCTFHTAAGVSTYTVANNTTIRLVARGGDGSYKIGGNGGSGATIGATFSTQAGDIITMYVGTVAPVNNIAGGGGGATGVVLTRPGTGANYLLIIAGGGGGGSVNSSAGGQGGRSSVSSAAAAGSSATNYATGGGGYGFTAAGWNNNTNNYHLTGGSAGGSIPATGGTAALPAIAAGGTNNSSSNGGNGGAGFGGGGAAFIFYGGGGGGYAGGDGGSSSGYGGGGGYGGTSYVNTTSLSGTIVLQQDGVDGSVLSSAGSANANGEVDIEELTSGTNTYTWKGSTSTSATVAKNWCGVVPGSSNDILIVPGTTFVPAISGTGSYHNLTINAGATLNVTGTVQLSGDLTNNGTLSATTGTLVLNGVSAQTINANNTTVKNLTFNNSIGATLSSALNVTGIVTPTNGILNAAGYLTLKSTGTGTASVAAGGSTNYIAGNVIVERYIPVHSTRSYTLVSSPVGSPTIYTAWQEDGVTTNPGYGTLITGAATGNGFDAVSAAGIASIYSYNDNNATGSKWTGLTNTNATSLNAGVGYLLFVRGDRSTQPNPGAGSSATTLRATGVLTSGNVNFLTSGGTAGTPALLSGANQYNLIANPYACAIDWIQSTQGNLTGAFTVYDPNLAVFVTSDGTTKSPNVGQQQARYIQNGQAFFIQNDGSGSTPFLIIAEYNKSTTVGSGTAVTVFGSNNKAQLNINLYKQDTVFADGAVVVFGENYNKGLGAEDIAKFSNFNEMVSFHTGNKNLSIDKRPMPATTDTLFLNMKQMQAGTAYKAVIDASGFNNSNTASATLIDRLTATSQALDLTAKNEYPFTFTGSADSGRLMIVLNVAKTIVVAPPVSSDSIAAGLTLLLSPNPVKDQLQVSFHTNNTQHKQIRLINAAGQSVQTVDAGTIAEGKVMMPVAAYAAGLYTVELLSGSGRVQTAKLIKQ